MKEHLTDGDLQELVGGEAVSTRWVKRLLHLRHCDSCQQRAEELLPGRGLKIVNRLFPSLSAASRDPDGPDGQVWVDLNCVPDAVLRKVLELNTKLAREEERAVQLWHRFRDHKPERWSLLARNHPGFATLGMVELLLRESRRFWRRDGRRAELLTRLALEIHGRLQATEYDDRCLTETGALVRGYLANALRIQDRFAEADVWLKEAEGQLSQDSALLETAWLRRFRAALAKDQRLLPAALEAAREARRLFCRVRASKDEGWMLLQESFILGDMGSLEESTELVERFLRVFEEETVGRELYFVAIQHLTVNLARDCKGVPARRWLQEVQRRAPEFPEALTQARVVWTRGLVLHALGDWDRAVEEFLQSRDVFVEYGHAYDAALVCFDLAASHLEIGQPGAAAQLAAEMLPIFESLEIEREALAALLLFVKSLRQEQATVAAVREAAHRLRTAPPAQVASSTA